MSFEKTVQTQEELERLKNTINAFLNLSSDKGLLEIALNPNTPDSLLREIAMFEKKHFDYSVYEAVVNNENISNETMELISNNTAVEYPAIALSLIDNLPESVSENLASYPNSTIIKNLAKNSSLSQGTLKRVIKTAELLHLNDAIDMAHKTIKYKQDELNLASLMASYEDSKEKDIKVVSVYLPREGIDLSYCFPPVLDLRIDYDNYHDIAFVTFDNNAQLNKNINYADVEEAVENYLLEEDFSLIDTSKENLTKIEKSIDNIKNKLITPTLKETPYDTVDNLVYYQPMSTWSKKEQNEVFRNLKKVEEDISNISLFVYNEDRKHFKNALIEFENNNFLSFGDVIGDIEDLNKSAEKQLNSIKTALEVTNINETKEASKNTNRKR